MNLHDEVRLEHVCDFSELEVNYFSIPEARMWFDHHAIISLLCSR